jgi:hypothetical protein
MSAVAPPADLRDARPAAARSRLARAIASADARAVAVLGLLFAALTALTWRKWGVPAIDAGYELTIADRVSKGAVAYRDVRYFYGPVGLYALAGAFKVFGVSFTTAFAFGLVQTAAIVGTFYALARRLLPVLTAALASAVLLAIGFSGTAFNFILPHSNSATFGILFLLLMLLALSHERLVLASIAGGIVCLTRPEFAAFAALTGAAYVVGFARQEGVRAAAGVALRLAVPGLAIAGAVFAAFCAIAGAEVVFLQNVWPVDFLRQTKFGSQGDWAPRDLQSVVSTVARATVYCSLLGGLVASVALAARRSRGGVGRVLSLWPLAAVGVVLVLGYGAWSVVDVFPRARGDLRYEATHLIIGMSWLPALGFGVAAVVAWRFLRGRAPLLTQSWAFDLALVAAAGALGARAYDAFTAEGSYAPYYAAPLVLLLGVLHQRVAERWPSARRPAILSLGAVAAGLAFYALVALYPDQDTPVHTARGTVMMPAQAAQAFQPTVSYVERHTRPGEPIVSTPSDAGIYFMTGRRPALYNVTFLPGLLDTVTDERDAVSRIRAEHVRVAVVGDHKLVGFGHTSFGRDYNRVFAGALERGGVVATYGDRKAELPGGTNPARVYRIYRLG